VCLFIDAILFVLVTRYLMFVNATLKLSLQGTKNYIIYTCFSGNGLNRFRPFYSLHVNV